MISKTYYLGQFKEGTPFEDNYFLGIHREGEGTTPFQEAKPITDNGVKNDITTKLITELEYVRGYLIALIGEYQFEGFDIKVKNWNEEGKKLFSTYLKGIDGMNGNIKPLTPQKIEFLETIVGIEIK